MEINGLTGIALYALALWSGYLAFGIALSIGGYMLTIGALKLGFWIFNGRK